MGNAEYMGEQPGGKQYNIQNFMMMYIFGATTNTEYRTKLFDHWPTYLEDFNECKAIMGYRYPETLVEEFLAQGVTDKSSRILDLACGPGNVAFILRDHGYTNIDGLDPSPGLLAAAQEKGLYKKTICAYLRCSPLQCRHVPRVHCASGVHRAVEGCETRRPDRLEYGGRLRRFQRLLP